MVRLNKVFFHFLNLAFILHLTSCFSGGTTVPSNEKLEVIPNVPVPTVSVPFSNPYYSSNDYISITGMCQVNATVELLEASLVIQTQVCSNATYTFNVSKTIDGVYSFLLRQINADGKTTSSPATLVWIRKTSVSVPVLTNPTTNPYLSADSTLLIQGSCETGALISLGDDGAGSVVCASSAFSLNLPKAVDGDYNISVSQLDQAGNRSTISFIWKKKNLTVSPLNPVLQVTNNQTFSVSGGDGNYTATVITNLSGGSYNAATLKYTTGTLANVTDVIEFRDGNGLTALVNVNVVPGDADHLEKGSIGSDSGDQQSAPLNTVLLDPLKVKVVDQFGNGVASYPIYFKKILGDGYVTSAVLQVSDLNGIVNANFKLGSILDTNIISAEPLLLTLPDVANSGNPKLLFTATQISSTKNLGANYIVGQAPSQAAIADFNSDGNKDIAVLNSGGNSISLMFGKGKNSFNDAETIMGICISPNGLISADFNSDGKMDLAVSCGNSNTAAIEILLGVGNGTFQASQSILLDVAENIPKALIAADFNNDGKLDIALTSAGAGVVAVRFGNGDGSFQSAQIYSVGLSPVAIGDADLNKDGKLDLLVANAQSDNVSVLMNNGSGLFLTAVNYDSVNPVAFAVADFNNDSFKDIAVVNASNSSVGLFINDQTGSFNAGVDLGVGGSPNSIVAVDFNKDGNMDLFISNGDDNNLTEIDGLGTGIFQSPTNISVVTNPIFMTASDLDMDTITDLIVLGNQDHVMQILPGQNPQGQNYTLGYKTDVDLGANSIATGDFDRDGYSDIAVVNSISKSVNILRSLGNGLFVKNQTISTGDVSNAIVAVDLFKNSKLSLIVSNPVLGQILVLPGSGDGSFGTAVSYGVGNSPAAIIAQDFNSDSFLDIAVVNSLSNTVSILINNGDGTLKAKVDYATGGAPSAIVAADLNHDQIIDLIIANKNSGTLSVLIGNRNGTFQTHIDYTSGSGPSALVAADFNNDGNIDIAVNSSTDSLISVLTGSGDGALSFNLNDNFSAGLDPAGLVSGDFNHDGRLDLAVSNGVNQSFAVLWGNGNAKFQTNTVYPTNFSTGGLYTEDFNADGYIDLGVIDLTNNSLKLWIGH